MAQSRADIAKRYREKHPERVKETIRKYRLNNKEKISKIRVERYLLNKESENLSSKRWYGRNKDYRKLYTKQYRSDNKKLFDGYKDLERFGGNKTAIFQRDNYVCRLCNATQSGNGKPLVIHHIDGSGGTQNINNNLTNLITLCNRCHHHTHRHQRKYNFTFSSIEDIVRTMARVIEEYRNIHPVPRRSYPSQNSNK